MDKRRKTMVCPHNDACACTEAQRTCWKCGWNPNVQKKRKDKILQKMGVKKS